MEIFIKDQDLTLKENALFFLKDKGKVFFIGLGLIVLFLLLVFSQKQRSKELSPAPFSQVKQLSQDLVPQNQPPIENPPPKVSFAKYRLETSFPNVPPEIKLYTFKTNYSDEEVRDFAQIFGLFDLKPAGEDFVIASNLKDTDSLGYLVFNKKTGGFSFQSYGNHKLQASSGQPTKVAQSFLAFLGVIDETITCPITYQRQGLSGVTFVECHRDWNLVGGPILNFVGVLNIPEGERLADISLGSVDENTPDDPSIINVSTGDNGKVRPNDFNTITVAVANDGRIISIESNLRQIVETQTVSQTELLTPQEALNQFINHGSQLSLTIPAGAGSLDLNKVYPGNLAQAKQATITDYVLVYLEKPAGVTQQALVPMYQIRGIAELSSGYRVRFTETVPALRSGLSFLYPIITGGTVAGLSAQLTDEKTIKLGSFTPAPTTPVSTPTTIITQGQQPPQPTPTPGLPPSAVCDPSNLEVVDLPGIGKVGLALGPHTFFYIPSGDPALDKSIDEVRRLFFDLVSNQYGISVSQEIRDDPNLLSMFGGSSPTIQNMYDLFDEINRRYKGKPGKYAEECRGGDGDAAPISPAAFPKGGVYFNYMQEGRVLYVAEKTAKILIEIIKNNGIDSWAAKSNIFPTKTLCFFSWVFLEQDAPILPGLEGPPTDCPYITGVSPSLYFYPQKPTKVTVKLGSPLTYTDPAVRNNSWEITAFPDGTVQSTISNQLSTISYSRLYYEYDKSKVSFTKPREGFVTKRESLEEFLSETLFSKLGLNQKEAEDLLADVRTSLIGTQEKPYLKISFTNQEELDQKLPLKLSPQPDKIYRIHLMLTLLDNSLELKEPKISKINRLGFVVVETGVVIQ